jgi:hypothetical protein
VTSGRQRRLRMPTRWAMGRPHHHRPGHHPRHRPRARLTSPRRTPPSDTTHHTCPPPGPRPGASASPHSAHATSAVQRQRTDHRNQRARPRERDTEQLTRASGLSRRRCADRRTTVASQGRGSRGGRSARRRRAGGATKRDVGVKARARMRRRANAGGPPLSARPFGSPAVEARVGHRRASWPSRNLHARNDEGRGERFNRNSRRVLATRPGPTIQPGLVH